jgi:hypothetical protein
MEETDGDDSDGHAGAESAAAAANVSWRARVAKSSINGKHKTTRK